MTTLITAAKETTLIQDWRKFLFHLFNFLVKVSFAYFCFSRLTSFNVKFYLIYQP